LFAVDEKFPFIAFLFSFIIGIFLISRGYKKFRYGGEVEEGTGLDESTTNSNVINKNEFMKSEGFGIAKNVAASVVIGSVISSLLNSRR